MTETPEEGLSAETIWIRAYACTYLPNEGAFTFPPQVLRDAHVTLVDVRNALRTATVTYSNKLDDPGAIWIAEGFDADDRKLEIKLHVISSEISVTLKSVVVLEVRKEGPDDAA